MRNKHTFAIIYTTILIIVTVWSLLDTFVIANKIAVVDETLANTSIYADLDNEYSSSSNSESILDEYSSSDNSESISGAYSSALNSDSTVLSDSDSSSDAPIITDYSYQDSDIQITIEIIRQYNTDIYIADVLVSDVAYLKTALANNTYGRNIKETTSDMADEHEAILAINGDYYGFRNAGLVIRNGVLYQTTARSGTNEALVINADGSFEIIDEGSADAQILYDEGALQVFTFGPGLIEDGGISVASRSEVSQSIPSNPRTAIGMIDKLHYIFVVSDGRTSQSAGLSLLELAEVMQEYGCTVAYNLDGGGSSTMVFNGVVINNPTDGRSYGERKVSDIIYIGEHL
jgi:exopolysaccharide biosynthesis protein